MRKYNNNTTPTGLVPDYTMKIKRLHQDAIMPTYAHEGDSGFDLYTVEDVAIKPQETVAVPTGIAIALPPNTELQIRPRSGITLNGVRVLIPEIIGFEKGVFKYSKVSREDKRYERVQLGTVDNNYRGELGIITYNQSKDLIIIPKGTKLAQGVVVPVVRVSMEEVEELDSTNRGEDGYGSTGTI